MSGRFGRLGPTEERRVKCADGTDTCMQMYCLRMGICFFILHVLCPLLSLVYPRTRSLHQGGWAVRCG